MRATDGGRNAAVFSIAGGLCLATSIGLVTATIVLALIPIYISNTAQASNSSSTSQEITLTLPVQNEDASGRRRRQSTSLDSLIGSELSEASQTEIGTFIKNNSDQTIVDAVNITSAILAYKDDGKRRRWALTKRQTRTIIIKITCFFIYRRGRSDREKERAGPRIRQSVINAFNSNSTIKSMEFVRNGQSLGKIRIRFFAILFISSILPSSSGNTVEPTPTTGAPTVTPANFTTVRQTTTAPGTPLPG